VDSFFETEGEMEVYCGKREIERQPCVRSCNVTHAIQVRHREEVKNYFKCEVGNDHEEKVLERQILKFRNC
jgi:hypothetical protein